MPTAVPDPSATSHVQTHRMRIFLVENHQDTLKYLKMYLEALGHSVRTARTMKAALEAIPSEQCDVLISDIGLPDGSGWDLLKQARFAQPVYAVAISGFGAAHDFERSRDAGFRRHLVKPFVPEDLLEAMEEAGRELGR